MTTTAAAAAAAKALSIPVTDSSGNLVQLRVEDSTYLYVESRDNTQQQQYELKYIYGIEHNKKVTEEGSLESTTIDIHYCHVTDPQEQDSGEQTITNFRSAGIKLWKRRSLHFQATTTDITPFINEFRELIYPSTHGDHEATRIMVVLNPAAGARQALTHWETVVKPMLSIAGFTDFQITHTQPNGKTRGLVEQLGVQMLKDKRNTIVLCMGGDGTTHEVVNGLSDAFDGHVWKQEEGEEEEEEVPTFRLGIIPSGSGNALSLSLNLESIEHGVLQVIKGRRQPLRLIDVSLDPDPTPTTFKRRRILVVMSWGFHAQLVSKSRYLQPFMGNTRFSWVAMFLMMFLQQHQGELTMKHAQRYDRTRKAFVHEDENNDGSVTLKDKAFTYFLVGKQHSMERGFKIAPFASPTTGDMDVVMMRGVSREELKAATIKVLDGGRHVDDETGVVEYYKTPELSLRVKHGSELCLDGEIVELAAGGVVRLKMIGPHQGEPDFQSFV